MTFAIDWGRFPWLLVLLLLLAACTVRAEGPDNDPWEELRREKERCAETQVTQHSGYISRRNVNGCETVNLAPGADAVVIKRGDATFLAAGQAALNLTQGYANGNKSKAELLGTGSSRTVYPLVDQANNFRGTVTRITGASKPVFVTPLHVLQGLAPGAQLYLRDESAPDGRRYIAQVILPRHAQSGGAAYHFTYGEDVAIIIPSGMSPRADELAALNPARAGESYASLSFPQTFGSGTNDPNLYRGNIIQGRSVEGVMILSHEGQYHASSGGAVLEPQSGELIGIELCFQNNQVKALAAEDLLRQAHDLLHRGQTVSPSSLPTFNLVPDYADDCTPIRGSGRDGEGDDGSSGTRTRNPDGRGGGG